MVKEQDGLITDFDDATVQKLNERQVGVNLTPAHPYTCAYRSRENHGCEGHNLGVLIATPDGWVCPYCNYTQDYAYASSVAAHIDLPKEKIEQIIFWMRKTREDIALEIIEDYRKLAADIEFHNLGPAESKDRRLNAVRTMIGCLRRFCLAQYGIETRPGETRGVSADWVSLDDRWPVEGEGEVFEVVCERHPEDRKSSDPLDGDLEVKLTRIEQYGELRTFEISLIGWTVHWWRPASRRKSGFFDADGEGNACE